ncbi:MAG: protein-L-isoaspartate O-methyltransferase [Verrucomicrobia bacterium]|nr:MAG: protein-L-isoaspartate O-methyltransferase [Verrucomicrobiota bacterium]
MPLFSKKSWGDEQTRERMVEVQLRGRGIGDQRVLDAFLQVPRHRFVSVQYQNEAYADYPLPIGSGQTISQPYIVAAMVEALGLTPESKVLEIGTGCGYQTAILAEVAAEVFTIEIIPGLAVRAQALLESLEYPAVHFRTGDGSLGWPEAAPFDGIVVSAAPSRVPDPLLEQLDDDGCCVIPVGDTQQLLKRLRRDGDSWKAETMMAVRFVPMTGPR